MVVEYAAACPVNLRDVSSFQVVGTVASTMLPDRALLPHLRGCPPPARGPDAPRPAQRQAQRRGAGPTPSASGARATGGPASLAAHRPSPTRGHQSCSAQASLAIAPAQPRDAAPLASGAGPPQMGRLPETPWPTGTRSRERAPRRHPSTGQGPGWADCCASTAARRPDRRTAAARPALMGPRALHRPRSANAASGVDVGQSTFAAPAPLLARRRP